MSHTVFITGVGKRLGLATAKHLIAQGFRVVGTYRTPTDGIEALFDLGATLYPCDFFDVAQTSALMTKLHDNHPRFRALIHNASDWDSEQNTDDTAALFDRMMTIHAKIPYQINLALRQHLLSSTEESDIAVRDIIHISDYVAETGSDKHLAYAASKAALNNLSLSFAKRFAPKIKVNTISPALMLFNDHDSDAYREKTLTKALLPKEGGTEEFTQAIDYLMQSKYVTGRILQLDGGRHLK